ncbi:glycosyltransferase family 4 protein [Roseomonas sp. BN140053]|uniref:glycosyltransferase family 4 protein n=1 Tax=Roseomonas sp. BN140053 TaxID=3391898 RepID=UPI0039E761B3
MPGEPLRLFMTADAVGGVWPYALDLARGLAAEGVRTTLAVLGPTPAADQLAEAAAVPGLSTLHTDLPLDWLAADADTVERTGEALAELVRADGADLLHLNSPAHAAAARFPVPVVGVAHSCVATWWDAVKSGPLPEDFRWRTDLTGRGYRAVGALVVPSAAFAADTARVYSLPEPPIAMHNGRREVTATAISGAPESFALTAGRLWDEGKGIAALDRAAGRLRIPVLAAGAVSGPNGAAISLQHIRPLGRMPERELSGWMAAAPVFVSTALYEPFGFAVLEAVRAGAALVLSDIPSFRELWDGAAEFVPPHDDAAIAAAIQRLCDDPAHRARLQSAARQRAGNYGVAPMARAMLDVYRRLRPAQGTTTA